MTTLPLTLGAGDWLNLWLYYLSLSLLAVGGAIATAPDMHRFLVERQAWLTDPQFSASIAIAMSVEFLPVDRLTTGRMPRRLNTAWCLAALSALQ